MFFDEKQRVCIIYISSGLFFFQNDFILKKEFIYYIRNASYNAHLSFLRSQSK